MEDLREDVWVLVVEHNRDLQSRPYLEREGQAAAVPLLLVDCWLLGLVAVVAAPDAAEAAAPVAAEVATVLVAAEVAAVLVAAAVALVAAEVVAAALVAAAVVRAPVAAAQLAGAPETWAHVVEITEGSGPCLQWRGVVESAEMGER